MHGESKNLVIKNCGLHHVTVQARNLEVSLRFYRGVLGMETVAEFRMPSREITLLDVGDGSHIELFAPTGDTPAVGAPAANDPLVHIALATSDACAAAERVRRAGYEITIEPKVIDLGDSQATIAFCRGPSGEAIEFFQAH
jgi:catechol 2,3-dioxygenase-like lactoylglutathione lyase family enzyme